jgi:hypothetical protein
MKKCFYRLSAPYPEEQYRVYGLPEWAKRFGRAEWSENVVHMDIGRFGGSLPRGHPKAGLDQIDLTIILPSPDVGDFVWTWLSDCIVTADTLSLFKEAGFTGFEVRPVVVEKVKGLGRKRRPEVVMPSFWELVVMGKGGDAAPESGIHIIEGVGLPSVPVYSSFRNGIVVNEANWDGSDFFTINGYPKHRLVTERVKEFIMERGLTNCTLIPSHELEWKGVRREEVFAEIRALAEKDLSLLLADLENPGTLEPKTIHAIADKRDPRAIEPLIKLLAHPNVLIAGSAASALATIGGPKQASEQVRAETFTLLRSLLSDENPRIRSLSAEAMGQMESEQAGEEMTRLLQDRDASVRNTAVFQIGQLCYTPALEMVRRLTKDPDPIVRKAARRVLKELEFREFKGHHTYLLPSERIE